MVVTPATIATDRREWQVVDEEEEIDIRYRVRRPLSGHILAPLGPLLHSSPAAVSLAPFRLFRPSLSLSRSENNSLEPIDSSEARPATSLNETGTLEIPFMSGIAKEGERERCHWSMPRNRKFFNQHRPIVNRRDRLFLSVAAYFFIHFRRVHSDMKLDVLSLINDCF